jgi:hypothetical protein
MEPVVGISGWRWWDEITAPGVFKAETAAVGVFAYLGFVASGLAFACGGDNVGDVASVHNADGDKAGSVALAAKEAVLRFSLGWLP